jgi:hypothetical protein
MDLVLPLLACFVLGAPIGIAGSVLIGRGPQLMTGLFGGNRGLGWPQGVQEEDPPGGWTWHLPPSDGVTGGLASDQRAVSGSATGAPSSAAADTSTAAVAFEDALATGDVPILRPIRAQVGRGTNRLRSRW